MDTRENIIKLIPKFLELITDEEAKQFLEAAEEYIKEKGL